MANPNKNAQATLRAEVLRRGNVVPATTLAWSSFAGNSKPKKTPEQVIAERRAALKKV